MHGSFHAQTRPHTHTEAFIHRNFHTEKSLHIFYHLSCFMINQHLSSSYLSVHDLVVNSLLLFFRATWSFSFHVAPCSVRPGFVLGPLQRVKLNEGPGINSPLGYRYITSAEIASRRMQTMQTQLTQHAVVNYVLRRFRAKRCCPHHKISLKKQV